MKLYNKACALTVLILLQSVSVMLLSNKTILNYMNTKFPNIEYPFWIGVIINIFGISALVCIHYTLSFLKREKDTLEKLNNSEEIIYALTGQKHDFQNHLNVISGLIQLNKLDKALEYTYKISGKTTEVFSISKIENLEVAALLYRKYAIAENKGITVELEIDTCLENIKIDSIDLCKILFNLIDNAIHELENCKEDEKILNITMMELEDRYSISVLNSYPILPPHLYTKIFEQGYTTKTENGHGHGLSIIQQIIRKHYGSITLESYEDVGTIFTVFLPKKNIENKSIY